MKILGLLVLFSASSALFAGSSPDFLSFSAEPAKPFGREDAEKLASAQFDERYGACGIVIFKERKFEAWTFETRIGYGGVKGPDIVVYSTSSSRVSDLLAQAGNNQEPKKAPELTPRQP